MNIASFLQITSTLGILAAFIWCSYSVIREACEYDKKFRKTSYYVMIIIFIISFVAFLKIQFPELMTINQPVVAITVSPSSNLSILLQSVLLMFLLLLFLLICVLFRFIREEKYGTLSVVDNNIKIFKNHDLMIVVNGEGDISLLGHGAFSNGYYSKEFNNVELFKNFISDNEKDFSYKQHDWLSWVVDYI